MNINVTNGKPSENGKRVGEIKQTEAFSVPVTPLGIASAAFRGIKEKKYWEWNGRDWVETTKTNYLASVGGSTSFKSLSAPTLSSATSSLRYPEDAAMAYDSDYVLFEFYEYKPPFQGINSGDNLANSTPLATYNQSVTDEAFYDKTTEKSVVLYMPEDISTGYKANWSGKAFSNLGRDALTTAGSGDLGQTLSNAGETLDTSFNQLLPNLGNKTIQSVISKITGENISQNDIFSSTRGVILNPNVELLFGGIDLRNFTLNYKLVPRNEKEANNIKSIVNVFRRSMLPRFAEGDELTFSSADQTRNNYIKVPNVCKVSFMKGGSLNEYVPQYKMCAITQVDVNYTPDGMYATYGDGHMVAIGLTLNFQETKLIFAEEVDKY